MLLTLMRALRGGKRVFARFAGGMCQMDTQQSPDFSVEIHFASLDSRSKERAWTYIENRSSQSQAVRLDQAPNANVVTNLHILHSNHSLPEAGGAAAPTAKTSRQATRNYHLWTRAGKDISRPERKTPGVDV
jgi:hypothetical protein